MVDLVTSAMNGAANGSSAAPALAFAAGVASSFGPCIGPRMLAVAALCARHRGIRRWVAAGIFAAGLCAGYAIVGTIAGAAGLISAFSPWVYRALAVVACVAGIWTIIGSSHAACRDMERRVGNGFGFFAGLASASVTSPCCGPLGAALAGLAAASAGPRYAASILTAFAVGHVMPLVIVAAGSFRTGGLVARALAGGVGGTISGSLMLAAGAYYGVLA